MKNVSKRKWLCSGVVYRLSALAVLLAALPAFTLAGYAITSSSEDENLEQDYFNSDYAYLEDGSSVYHGLTYDQLVTLFEQEGNYLVLFGGSWCSNTNPVIGYINEVAKEYGVDSIYTFDFRFDGMTSDTHIRESNGATHSGKEVSGAQYNYLYGELVTRYLGNLNDYAEYKLGTENELIYTNSAGEDVAVPKIQVPFLFLYNKDHRNEAGEPAQIVSGLELMMESSDFIDENNNTLDDAIAEYKDILRAQVFDAVKTVELSTYTDAGYYRTVYNRAAGTELFGEGEQINLRALTYRQLYWLLGRSGNYLLYFGGAWSEYSAAQIKQINDFAVENQVIVYNFDPKLDGGSVSGAFGYGASPDISDSQSGLSGLYADILEKLAYSGESLPEGYLVLYNKNAADDNGHAAPILAYADLTAEDPGVELVFQAYVSQETGVPQNAARAGSEPAEAGAAGERDLSAFVPRIAAAVLIAAVVAVTVPVLSYKDKKGAGAGSPAQRCC